jgi:DNA-directed RNA polymerase subunit RPC12/RpoP
MKFIDTLDHFCVKNADLHIHPQPEFYHCATCGDEAMPEAKVHLTEALVDKVGAKQEDGSVNCPDCGNAMSHSGPRHFAELHVDVCLDKSAHSAEQLAAGEITAEEYQAWANSLTPREQLGYYQRIPTHHLTVKLNHAEIDLMGKDPAAFQTLLHSKLKARLEMDAQFTVQHRYQHDVLKVAHLLKEFRK